jgi:hypothetical protein
MFHRSWEQNEDYNIVRESYRSKLVNLMGSNDAAHIFIKRTIKVEHYDDIGMYVPNMLELDESDVDPKEFICFLNKHNYFMPHDFKTFIGKEEKSIPLTEREQNTIAKNVCQGIAKTLWDINPEMTITDMCLHSAIQNYGDGKLFGLDTTLHRWLSEVDPRKKKTGPKKPIL